MSDPDNDLGSECGGSREDDYKVGYKKPPKATQFKPGNKRGKGRPKGAKNIGTIVNEALGMKIAAQIGGKKVKASKFEIAMHQLANQGSSGDQRAIQMIVSLYAQYGPQETGGEIAPEQTAYDLETLKHYLQMSGKLPFGDESDGEE